MWTDWRESSKRPQRHWSDPQRSSHKEWLEHLLHEETQGSGSSARGEKAQGDLTSVNTRGKDKISQSQTLVNVFLVPGSMGTHWNSRGSLWTSGILWEQLSTGTSCPRDVESPSLGSYNFLGPWRYTKPGCRLGQVDLGGSAWKGDWTRQIPESPPNSIMLWFCDFKFPVNSMESKLCHP